MTNRIKGLTVTLKDDFREDDCEAVINAIGLLYGVISVERHVSDIDHHMAKEQVRSEIRDKILNLWKSM